MPIYRPFVTVPGKFGKYFDQGDSMSTSFEWTIDNMIVAPQQAGQNDVVTEVHWRCTGSDGSRTATITGPCGVSYQGGAFTNYSDLTLNQVLDWLDQAGINRPFIESLVQDQIAAQTVDTITMPPPWQD